MYIHITMHNDIEQFINENLSLRKAYQLCKSQNDALAKELKELKQKYRQLQDNYNSIADQNSRLFQKNKSIQAQLANNNASFVSQIEELKSLIEQKQNELQNFQLKMIPSLDQDMLRVKLIAQMQGPYQEEVQKKERQINKLKDQVHQLKRQKQIIEFSLSNKDRQLKKQIEDLKIYYDNQIDRLTRQLAHFSHKSTSNKMEKDILKAYRQEIDQLRSTNQFMKNVEDELRKQLAELRVQRQKLLGLLKIANAQKALQLQQSEAQPQLAHLKSQLRQLQQTIQNLQRQLQRTKQKQKSAEDEKNKNQHKYTLQIKDLKFQMEQQHERYKNENEELKAQLRKFKDLCSRREEEIGVLTGKVRDREELREEIRILKHKIGIYEEDYSSRSNRVEDTTRVQRELRQKIERELTIKIRKQIQQQYRQPRQPSPTRDPSSKPMPNNPPNQTQPHKQKDKTRALQQKIMKLTKKLEFANKKILELLKQKANRSTDTEYRGGRDPLLEFSPEHEYHKILLENRDCGFVPMCPPVVVERGGRF